MFKIIILMMMLSCVLFAGELDVMTFNVENLFDAKKDFGKDDWTFLPLGTPGKEMRCRQIRSWKYRRECFEINWTHKNLALKLKQIKRVVDARPRKPDFLAIIEIENENVLKMLAERLGYKNWIITNSFDRRGIDVALLYSRNSAITFVEAKEHYVGLTRNILEARFIIDKKHSLAIFVNHWPSQRSSTKRRNYIAGQLRKIIESNSRRDNVLVLGDFNTIETEHPHPFRDLLIKDKFLFDLDSLYMKNRKIVRVKKAAMPPGTYFYSKNMSWNKLDRIFINQRLKSRRGMYADNKTYQIFAPKFMRKIFKYRTQSHLRGSSVAGVPWKYNFTAIHPSEAGFSDHFPVVVKLYY